jgi:DNA-binding transcriptional LysR family regulator
MRDLLGNGDFYIKMMQNSHEGPAASSYRWDTRMRTSIQSMKIFVRAVEANSFTGAAQSLLIDPTAVSRAIKALESDLNVLLFVRSTHALNLTPEGASFYRDCIKVLKTFEEATARVRAKQVTLRRQLTIGIAPGLAYRMLLRALPAFQQQFPQIDVVLRLITDNAQIGGTGIDVIVRGTVSRKRGALRLAPQGLITRKLAQSRFVVCASPQYLDRVGAPRVPTDLLQHSCVVLLTLAGDVRNEWHFVKSNVRQKVKLVPRLLVQGTDPGREAAVAGCGIIRLTVDQVEDELRAGTLIRVLPDWDCTGAGPMFAIFRKTRPMPQQISVFVQHLAEAFRRYNVP